MSEKLISVRMPSSLIKELKLLVKPNHYMDFSEQLRSIIRRKIILYSSVSRREDHKRKEELLRELRRVLLEEVAE